MLSAEGTSCRALVERTYVRTYHSAGGKVAIVGVALPIANASTDGHSSDVWSKGHGTRRRRAVGRTGLRAAGMAVPVPVNA